MEQTAKAPGSQPLDIDASAREVSRLLNANQGIEAMRLLEQQRQGQPQAVQEALDRKVLANSGDALDRSRAEMQQNPQMANSPELTAANRVDKAGGPPRTPTEAEVGALTPQQRYDVYASIVQTRGNDAAREALNNGDRVILGLRTETSTLASSRPDNPNTRRDESQGGTGVYDDRVVVLGRRDQSQVWQFNQANTEPTAQYSERAVNGQYPNVNPRRAMGVDVNRDGILDPGRMREGTFEMVRTTHPNPGPNDFSLMPSNNAVRNGANMIERDVNGDGRFNAADGNRRTTNLDQSFKIHAGSINNTDSAGCQTIVSGEQFNGFTQALRGNPGQTRWQYVLTETGPAQQQVQGQQPGQQQNAQQDAPAHLQATRNQQQTSTTGQGADPLRTEIESVVAGMKAARDFTPQQRENVVEAAYTKASEATQKGHEIAQVKSYDGQHVVATVAPNGMGKEPMTNYAVNAEKVKDISVQASVEQRQANNDMVIAQNIEPKKTGPSLSV